MSDGAAAASSSLLSTAGGGDATDASTSSIRVLIAENTVTLCKGNGIAVLPGGTVFPSTEKGTAKGKDGDSRFNITKNTVSRSDRSGVLLAGGEFVVSENKFDNNREHGLEVRGSYTFSMVNQNTSTLNWLCGFFLWEDPNVTIKGNIGM